MARPEDDPFHPNPMENNVDHQQEQNAGGNANNDGTMNEIRQFMHQIRDLLIPMCHLLHNIWTAVRRPAAENAAPNNNNRQHNSADETPLMMAIKHSNTTMALMLIERDANVHIANRRGHQAVHYAVKQGLLIVLEKLVRKGADVDARDSKCNTPLHLTCLKGKLEVARLLIGEHADVNATNRKGATPLQYAVWNGHLEVAEFLLTHGANINAQGRLSNADLGVDTSDEE